MRIGGRTGSESQCESNGAAAAKRRGRRAVSGAKAPWESSSPSGSSLTPINPKTNEKSRTRGEEEDGFDDEDDGDDGDDGDDVTTAK